MLDKFILLGALFTIIGMFTLFYLYALNKESGYNE